MKKRLGKYLVRILELVEAYDPELDCLGRGLKRSSSWDRDMVATIGPSSDGKTGPTSDAPGVAVSESDLFIFSLTHRV